jgi:hypothetical protein
MSDLRPRLDEAIADETHSEMVQPHGANPLALNQGEPMIMNQGAEAEDQDAWLLSVLTIFPDMCPRYLADLGTRFDRNDQTIIPFVAEEQEAGKPYPTAKQAKRKRRDSNPSETSHDDKKVRFDIDKDRLAGRDAIFLIDYRKAA